MIQIVVVEDDTWLAEHYLRVFSEAGFTARHTTSAIEAIDVIDEVKPDAIFLDMLLAATTGLALLHELQSYGDLAAIPVVMCTNNTEELSIDLLAPYGVRRLLDKTTMHPSDLVAAVRSVTV